MFREFTYTASLFLASTVFANEPQPWSIDDCMRYAVALSYDVKTAEISSDNSRIDYNKSKAALFPTVGASLAAQYSFGRSIDPAANTFSTFTTECLTLKKTMNYPVADSLQLSDSIRFPAKSKFSTAEILDFAAANNPSMRQAQLNADAAKYALRSAKGNLAPHFSTGCRAHQP